MTKYLFDQYGTLIKQWWWCETCKVNFCDCVEVCPSCEKDGLPTGFGRHELPSDEPFIQHWNDKWCRVRQNPREYNYLMEYISDVSS